MKYQKSWCEEDKTNKIINYQPKFNIHNFCEIELIDSVEISEYYICAMIAPPPEDPGTQPID